MLSEGLQQVSREGLTLDIKFSRSISEPGHTRANMPLTLTPLLSPPSLAPSIHPPKRPKMCRMAGAEAAGGGFLCPGQSPGPASTVSLPPSPLDAEGNTLQRSLVIQQTATITDTSLARKLQRSPASPASPASPGRGGRNFLLLDCRPFIAYNVSHIKGAINVNCCDRFNRKRLQQGKASLADLATTKEGKEMLKKRNWKEIIVYDDGSEDLSCLPSSHTLFLVIKSLVEDCRQPVMLVGGIRCFQVSCPAAAAAAVARLSQESHFFLVDTTLSSAWLGWAGLGWALQRSITPQHSSHFYRRPATVQSVDTR